jgi:hypothetical protein
MNKKERIKTMKTSNGQCRKFVQERKPFKGNNLFSEQDGSLYVVYSYGHHWPLFVCDRNGLWYENADKYSVSTSKHKSQSNPFADTIPMSVGDLRQFINKYR